MSKGWKISGITVTAILVYAVTLVLATPVSWLWDKAGRHVRLPAQVQILQVSGRLWEGAALVRVRAIPFRLDWSLGLPSLESLSLPVTWRIRSAGSDFGGMIGLSSSKIQLLDAQGRISPGEAGRLNPLNRIVVDGSIQFNGVNLAWDVKQQSVVAASGQGRWTGGNVSYPGGGDMRHAVMPPMLASLQQSADATRFLARDESASFDVIEARLTTEGLAEIQVTKRLLDLIGEPWGTQSQEQDVIFRVKQQLWVRRGGQS